MKRALIIASGVALLVIIGAGSIFMFKLKKEPTQIACTQEAKLCPDGSAVGRTGPNCEFAKCPEDTPPVDENKSSFTLETQIEKSVSALGVTITPHDMVEDSRCPTDVVCVWAGTVRVRVLLKSGLGEEPQIFKLGEPITTETEEITLTDVKPAPLAKTTIAPKDYSFTFLVKKRTAHEIGSIQGGVDIGPICPVERQGVPCPVPPEAYTSRQIIIYAADGKTEVIRKAIGADGKYSFQLPVGSYVLDLVRQGIDRGSSLPHLFIIKSWAAETFNFSIDTGIR